MWKVIKKILKGIWTTISVFRSIVLNLIFLFLLITVIGALSNIDIPTVIPDGAAIVIAPQGTLVDSVSTPSLTDSFSGNTLAQTELGPLLNAIKQAGEDDLIKAMILNLNSFGGGGFSKLRDLGVAIEGFKNSGKKVFAVGDNFTQGQYYVASFADEIILNPMGAIEIEGFSSYQTYYKNALDKLSIDINVFRVGEYKSAVEPYLRDSMSAETKVDNLTWLNDLWQVYLNDIREQRNLDEDNLNDYINNLAEQLENYEGDSARLALETGLVDQVYNRQSTEGYLTAELGEYRDTGAYSQIAYNHYLNIIQQRPDQRLSKDKQVGVIIASGQIYDGAQTAGNIGGDSLASLIRQAREDDIYKALVLRIDSGGGSAFASEVIRQELLHFKSSGKPLVVSMGSTAASGGYWIATPADEIWANPATITGSIGIYTLIPTFDRALERLGITVDGVGTTELSGAMEAGRPLPDKAANAIQQTLENGYQRFLDVVSAGREMSIEEVDAIARGRVWSGQRALEIGLVDELGSLDDAIEAAANLAGLDTNDYDSRLISLPRTPFEEFMAGINDSLQQSSLTSRFFSSANSSLLSLYKKIDRDIEALLQLNDPRSMYVHCLECQMQ